MLRLPVSLYMSREPVSVRADSPLEVVATVLSHCRISATPVVDDQKRTIGVVSRRDLLRVGELFFPEGRKVPEWRLPDKTASDAMTEYLVAVTPDTSIAKAASHMVDDRIHRVFVEEEGELQGVLTTRDVMQALVDMRVETPISRVMSEPVQTIATFEPLLVARRQLEELEVRGLVVAEEGIPVGIFTQEDALASRHADANMAVEHVMSHAFLTVEPDLPVRRAAARMAIMGVRRIIVTEGDALRGILTGFDLTKAAALD